MRRFFSPGSLLLILFMAYYASREIFADPAGWFQTKLMILPGIVIGLAFHEFAHAFVADRLGDNTPRLQGRVTLNPMAHIDPVGFVALLFVGFGWGVPVEIDPRSFKNRRRDELMVSLAGVVMNLLLAIVFTLVLKIFISVTGVWPGMGTIPEIAGQIIVYVIWINLVLMVFNLLPVPPLDGFNIITELFDLRKYDWWYTVYNNGFFILLILIAFNFTDRILDPILNFFWNILAQILI